MPSASEIKIFRSLKDKSSREELHIFAAETPKVVSDLIKGGANAEIIYVVHDKLTDWENKYPQQLIESVSSKELERLSFLKQPHDVSAIFSIPEPKQFRQENVTLILDNINDPGNMGTIIRSAHWFGIKNIICTENCVDVYNPKVVQSSMGSLIRVNVYYHLSTNISELLDKNTTVYGAYMDGESLINTDFKAPVAIIIGSEAHGIRSLESLVQRRISIPAHNSDDAPESLNASVAASILMSALTKII